MLRRILFAFVVTAAVFRRSPFRVQVNEVIVPVTVTDEKGRFVSNLDKKDFHIFDEGREQKIDYFSRERNQPVVVGFLIDMSNAMKIHWKKYQDAANELMLNLLPGDKKFQRLPDHLRQRAPSCWSTPRSDSEKMVQKLRGDEAGRRLRAVRRDLHGLLHPRAGQGRAVRTAPRHRDHRRRAR